MDLRRGEQSGLGAQQQCSRPLSCARGLVVVVVDGRFEVTMEREEVDGVLDTVAGGTEAPDDIVNSAALVARTVRDVVV